MLVKNKTVFMSPSPEGPSSEACQCPPASAPPAGALPTKGGMKSAAGEQHQQLPSKPAPTSPMRLPKDCHRSLGDLKVGEAAQCSVEHLNKTLNKIFILLFFFFLIPQGTRGLVARFLQRSRRNLSLSSEHAGSTGQGPKRRGGAEGAAAANHPPFEQVRQRYNQSQCSSSTLVFKCVHDD